MKNVKFVLFVGFVFFLLSVLDLWRFYFFFSFDTNITLQRTKAITGSSCYDSGESSNMKISFKKKQNKKTQHNHLHT